MGSSLSSAQKQYVEDVLYLLTKHGHTVTKKELEDLIFAIKDVCPWVPESGRIKLEDWCKIGYNFQNYPKISSKVLFTWCQVRACLKGQTPNNILFAQQQAGCFTLLPLPQLLPPAPTVHLVLPPRYEPQKCKPPDIGLNDNGDFVAPDLFPADDHGGGLICLLQQLFLLY